MNTELTSKKPWLTNWIFGTHGTCTYCGAGHDHIDHVIPVSWFLGTPRRPDVTSKGIRTYSCKTCNTALSNRFFESFQQRCLFAESKYRSRYGRIASLDEWDDDELDEIEGKLKEFVVAQQAYRQEICRRAEWPFSDSFYQNIADIYEQPCMDTASPWYVEAVHDYFKAEIDMIRSLNY